MAKHAPMLLVKPKGILKADWDEGCDLSTHKAKYFEH